MKSIGDKSYIAPIGALGVVHTGMSNTIRSLKNTYGFQNKVDEIIKTIWEVYCGADPLLLTNEFIEEATKLLTTKFASLGVNEICEAFRLASINIIHADLRAFGGRVPLQTIGKVLDAYSEYRKPIVSEILREEQQKMTEQEIEKDKEARMLYEEAVKDFWDNTTPASWHECPHYFLDTLSINGVVELVTERKHELFRMAERYRIEELERQRKGVQTVEDLRNVNRMLNNIHSEKAIITNYAKQMYLFELKLSHCKD